MAVPGLPATHSFGGVSLGSMGVWPRYRLLRISGLYARRRVELARDLPPGRDVEIPRRTVGRGKALVYEGVVEAQSQTALLAAIDALASACASTEEQLVTVSPWAQAPGSTYSYFAQVAALDISEQVPDDARLGTSTGGFERPFTLGLDLPDGRFRREPQVTSQTGVASPASGEVLPWSFPVVLPEPGQSSAVTTVVNEGNAPASPVIVIYGPISSPGVYRDFGEAGIYLSTNVAAGHFVELDFRARTVRLDGVTDIRSTLYRRTTTWWDGDEPGLKPGSNLIHLFSPQPIADPARALISYYHTYWS